MELKQAMWRLIQDVKLKSPLVHNITNYVVMNNTANALLAAGASPIMAHAHAELDEMVAICSASVINIGTLDEYWVQSMLDAASYANQLGKPWVLDPVGAGATSYRNDVLKQLLALKPTVIRGNASEIMAIHAQGVINASKGVDSIHAPKDAVQAARALNEALGAVVVISGAEDIIVSEETIYRVKNGHPMMTKVTGLGCSASALTGAFLGIAAENPAYAALGAMALLGVCGELAVKQCMGPGSLQLALLDNLYTLSESDFLSLVNLSIENEN